MILLVSHNPSVKSRSQTAPALSKHKPLFKHLITYHFPGRFITSVDLVFAPPSAKSPSFSDSTVTKLFFASRQTSISAGI